ncbi:His-Xaa-Ser system radical SAM maturase HxsC [Halomonas piscis]|uniref:His-Xaa-Ser system radical SAM maturase HxsC n=1 Tax=Halomonas piscis TaxID=3031727 RepID=UPI00289A18EF|nr:His-Xaa-Ser system radical SAM maturase HxsC [Halomonas piscis]
MPNPIRKDKFHIEDSVRPGFYRASHSGRNITKFLEEIVVSDSLSPHENSHTIISRELKESINEGDIILVGKKGDVRVILSESANHNTLLVTEQCDNRCEFCSQPPKTEEDNWLFVQAGLAIAEFQKNGVVGISGGEPLLQKNRFVNFAKFVAKHSPNTHLHVLTNGRALADKEFATELSKVSNNITLGIPLYSSESNAHDELVGSRGAFNETIMGLINAGNLGIPIEIRIIPTQKNYEKLSSVIELAARCFSSVAQISIMNLEPMGWAKQNWFSLYLKPSEYSQEILDSVTQAEKGGLHVALFNYPLCHIPESARDKAVQSISDWKNYYPPACEGCQAKQKCAGFFTSSKGIFHQSPEPIL